MKDNQEFIADIYDRYEQKKKEKRRRMKIVSSFCMTLIIGTGITVGALLGGRNASNESLPITNVAGGPTTGSNSQAYENLQFGGNDGKENLDGNTAEPGYGFDGIGGESLTENVTEANDIFNVSNIDTITVFSKLAVWTVSDKTDAHALCQYLSARKDALAATDDWETGGASEEIYSSFYIEILTKDGDILHFQSTKEIAHFEEFLNDIANKKEGQP